MANTTRMQNRLEKLAGKLSKKYRITTPEYAFFHRFYMEAHRQYHNIYHIDNLLDWHDALGGHLTKTESLQVKACIWWHDIIYDPSRHDNEETSALLFKSCSSNSGGCTILVHDICQTILDTKHLQQPRNKAYWSKYMLDLDLMGLSSRYSVFQATTGKIEQEAYWNRDLFSEHKRQDLHIGFLKKRTMFWSLLLERGFIYHNPYNIAQVKEKEEIAKSNINTEMGAIALKLLDLQK